MLSKEDCFEEILRYPIWRHRIPLNRNELTTMGYLSLPEEWAFNYLPESLNGQSFLDVGSNDGYFCFEAEKRGAATATATDLYHDGGNSNRTGWSVAGISLLKDYFNSAVDIHSMSVYDLHQLGRKYDVVLCSNVISWLDNLNEALKQLADVCQGTLYLKDGFLKRHDPEAVLQYERHKNLVTFRANLSYIFVVLKEHGFKEIEVKTIYHNRYFDWQSESFPGILNEEPVQIFASPNDAAAKKSAIAKGAWVLAEYNDCIFARGLGWIRKNEVTFGPRIKSSWRSKLLRSVLSKEQLADLIRRRGTEPYVKQYMIVAHK
jgi:SAM-dependent methyltransferase